MMPPTRQPSVPEDLQRLFVDAHRHHQAGHLHEAEQLYRQVLRRHPRHPAALHLLGVLAHQVGRHEVALELIARAIGIDDRVAAFHANFGNALKALGRLAEAVASYERALALHSDYAEAHYNRGIALEEQVRLAAAVASYHHAVVAKPSFAEAYDNLGGALLEQGKADQAHDSFVRALWLRPDFSAAATNLAFTQLYRGGVGLADIFDQAQRINAAFAARAPKWTHEPPVHQRPTSEKHEGAAGKPRLGFISADFRRHAVGFLLAPAFEGLARAGFHLTCYSNSASADPQTARFVAAAAVWRPVAGLSDAALAQQIQADGIDILVDLAGYSAGNRLFVLARKPAPIQVAWIGYPATTGMSAIDYLLADRHQVPPGAERSYSEAVVRLPDSYIVFEPPDDGGVPPNDGFRADGMTFGSFNALKKITPSVIAAWSTILCRLPTARLLIKAGALTCAATGSDLLARFAIHGVARERLQLVGETSAEEHRAWMRRVDIALDTFPYTGGQTTLETLWMERPLITLVGETFCSRHAYGYLAAIGLEELASGCVADYVERAVGLAAQPSRLRDLQSGLRARLQASALCDVDRFSEHLTVALMTMWNRWCTGRIAASFDVDGKT